MHTRPRAALAAAALAAILPTAVHAETPDKPQGNQGVAEQPEKTNTHPADITFYDLDEDTRSDDTKGPANPFGQGNAACRRDAVPGYVELSDGRKIPGKIYTTRGKRLKIYNLDRNLYEYVPVPALTRIDAIIEWERLQKEWRFQEPGNPEKVYSGQTYPARKLAWKLTLRNGHQVTGHILGQPLYVVREADAERWILHDRDKGPLGSSLESLLYIRHVAFGMDAYRAAVNQVRAETKTTPTD